MKKWPWFAVTVVIILLDQVTKYWANTTLIPYQPKAVMAMFNFTLAYNSGAAFSFLNSAGNWHRWFFTGFSAVMSLVLMVWIIRTPNKARLQLSALSLILAGAVGNLIDRILLGHVIDFIDVYYAHYHWPAFNVADSAICIGACILFIDACVQHKEQALKMSS